MDFSPLEKKIGVDFKDKALLKQAFVHRSYLNENKSSKLRHNERLEFLGDAVLGLVSATYLYGRYPEKDEGSLSSFRSALVNAVMLAGIAASLGMEQYLLLSHGESKDKGKARQIILADTMEALIGAIFLDQGYEAARIFIEEHILYRIDEVVVSGTFVDSKSAFQERAQEEEGVTPVYKVIRESGPDHDKTFVMGVYLGEQSPVKLCEGEGKSKQEAEQRAAADALKAKGW